MLKESFHHCRVGGADEGDGTPIEVGFGGFGDEGDREVHDFGEAYVDGRVGGVPRFIASGYSNAVVFGDGGELDAFERFAARGFHGIAMQDRNDVVQARSLPGGGVGFAVIHDRTR